MEILHLFYLFIAGIIAGFINVVAGGGSLLTLPLLIFMGLPPATANATNRLGVITNSIFGVLGFRSKGVSAWPYSLYLGISGAIGAYLGARISMDIPEDIFNKIIALIMVMVVLTIIFQKKSGQDGLAERMGLKHKVAGYVTFFFIGIYGGFLQAGAGFLIMAALVGINHFSLVKTNSAKVLIVLIYTLSSLVVFIIAGIIHWGYAIVLAAGSSIGGWIASRWSVDKGDVWIKRLLVVMVIVLAIKLWFYDT
ncbi:sulfite exporter TauE/SafE family protein [Fulvivirga sedimenti]|uniref:Probable membrane transporter protein n=1 Tax=Fulvivirga sedimenti TaxID=2879465 RepID=A0A9X1KYZ8_9BACT|nr:sulfite exporter TauE/SafE family protein [Fulvivirga sedimenti]MCA6075370.1 sulfite exporter TauE/SafE family protein [Fulvivirga sedimenti]MCA6076547.1 sulfite exporter TauE/SafE family protein [Fulvivirga sedimenti]MCA6077675.1 sulfite exporter TauE/SafE family protein [Fulvivirga sedimenti]